MSMKRLTIEDELDEIIKESTSLNRKDRDRLIDSLVEYLRDEGFIEFDEDEDYEDEDD